MERFELSDVLKNISEELWEANEEANKTGKATMIFTECEIDIAIETEVKGQAGLKIYVVNLGGDVKRSDKNTIKLKFTAVKDVPIIAKG